MKYLIMAEVQRFELWRGLHPLSVFKTDPFNHLGKLPDVICYELVDHSGLEPETNPL